MKIRIYSQLLGGIIAGLIFGGIGNGYGQIIPTNRTIAWSPAFVGVPQNFSGIAYTNGVPYRKTIFTNAAVAGCDTNGVKDCSGILQFLINTCPAGDIVYLPAGRYMLKSPISFGSHSWTALRGAGMGQTILIDGTTATSQCLIYLGTGNPEGSVKILSGSNKGSSNLVVSSTSSGNFNLFSGCMVAVTQPDDTNFVHNLVNSPYWGAPTANTNNLGQVTMVTKVSGNTISIWPPLIWDFTNALGANCTIFAQGTAVLDSIEDLTITHSNTVTGAVGQCQNSIDFIQCSQCWVRNVESVYVQAYHFTGLYLNQCTIRDCYFHEATFYGPSQGPGLLFYQWCCNSLVEDNIFYRCSPSMEINGASSGNVFSYNYSYETLDNPVNNQSNEIILADFDCNHGPHNIMNLWEGNVGVCFQSDSYFGSCSHQTLFRNNFTAAHPLANQFLRAIDLDVWSYDFNIVGNVLGTPPVTNLSGQILSSRNGFYEASTPNFPYTTPVIFRFGYPQMGNNSYPSNSFDPMPVDFAPSDNGPHDLEVEATTLLVDNYDYWHEAVVNPTNNLPPSLFYTSQPSWWPATNAWPPIGPDLTPMVSLIPAQSRFNLLINSTNWVLPPGAPPASNGPPTPQGLHVKS